MYKVFMKMRGYIAALLFIAIVAGSIVICIKVDSFVPKVDFIKKNKQYSHELAENVSYFDFEFINRELFTFKSCRIKKLRRGALTFGAFNVLELDDLVINIPVNSHVGSKENDAEGTKDGTNTFLRVFSSFKTMGDKRFSGININHLIINKYFTASQWVQLEAKKAESSFKRRIDLKQCSITTNSLNKISVENAYIEWQPLPAVKYMFEGKKYKIEL